MQKCIGGECIYGKDECCSECDEKEACKEVCDGHNVNGECVSKYEADDED